MQIGYKVKLFMLEKRKQAKQSFDSGIFFFSHPHPRNETLDGTCVNNAAILGRLNTTPDAEEKSSQKNKALGLSLPHLPSAEKRMTRIFAIIKKESDYFFPYNTGLMPDHCTSSSVCTLSYTYVQLQCLQSAGQ